MAGFTVNNTAGVFVFANGYTFPNPAVRIGSDGPLGLWFRDLVGDDVEVADGTVLYERVVKAKRADIPLEVSQHADSSGTAASNPVRQLLENLAELATIADLTESTGAQTVTYTPWTGATPVDLSAVVLPPLEGSVIRGVGVRAAVTLIVEDGAVLGDGSSS